MKFHFRVFWYFSVLEDFKFSLQTCEIRHFQQKLMQWTTVKLCCIWEADRCCAGAWARPAKQLSDQIVFKCSGGICSRAWSVQPNNLCCLQGILKHEPFPFRKNCWAFCACCRLWKESFGAQKEDSREEAFLWSHNWPGSQESSGFTQRNQSSEQTATEWEGNSLMQPWWFMSEQVKKMKHECFRKVLLKYKMETNGTSFYQIGNVLAEFLFVLSGLDND